MQFLINNDRGEVNEWKITGLEIRIEVHDVNFGGWRSGSEGDPFRNGTDPEDHWTSACL
jgi:hypothetical protein